MDESTLRFRGEHVSSHGISDGAMRRLGIEIISGKYKPGDRLMTELESAGTYGISRTAYREATRLLAGKGLISSRQKTGTVVNPRSSWHLLDPDILTWSFQNRPRRDFLDALFELRLTLEPTAAGFAAQRRSDAHIVTLRSCVNILAHNPLHSPEACAARRTFHVTILEATQNELLNALAPGIGVAAEWSISPKFAICRIRYDPIGDHVRLVKAIEDQSSEEAHGAATTLLLLAQEHTIDSFFGSK